MKDLGETRCGISRKNQGKIVSATHYHNTIRALPVFSGGSVYLSMGGSILLSAIGADCRAIYRRFFPALHVEGKEHSQCAFHDDRGPSLKLDKQSCYCFGACKQAYDAIDLYAKGVGCSKAEAIDSLAKELGISPDNGNGSRQEGRGSAATPSKRRDYAKEFAQALQTKPPREALDYLERRGLTSILPMLLEKKLIGFKANTRE